MLAVAQFRTVKTDQKRPTFKATSYVHDPATGNGIRLPNTQCVVIVMPAEPLNEADGFRQDSSGNPYVVYQVRGVEVADGKGGIFCLNPGCISLKTSFRPDTEYRPAEDGGQ